MVFSLSIYIYIYIHIYIFMYILLTIVLCRGSARDLHGALNTRPKTGTLFVHIINMRNLLGRLRLGWLKTF